MIPGFGHDTWWLILAKALIVFVFLVLTVLIAILAERKIDFSIRGSIARASRCQHSRINACRVGFRLCFGRQQKWIFRRDVFFNRRIIDRAESARVEVQHRARPSELFKHRARAYLGLLLTCAIAAQQLDNASAPVNGVQNFRRKSAARPTICW